MLKHFLDNVKQDLYDGKITLYDYNKLVRKTLGTALDSRRITYSEWSHLYYEYVRSRG